MSNFENPIDFIKELEPNWFFYPVETESLLYISKLATEMSPLKNILPWRVLTFVYNQLFPD